MNESYQTVKEQLRRQHTMNQNELHSKNLAFDSFRPFNQAHEEDEFGSNFGFKMKVLCFIGCVMLFSCYLYGGQDVKKGANMAYQDIKIAVLQLEEEEPIVKEAMAYCRQGYHKIRDAAANYLEEN